MHVSTIIEKWDSLLFDLYNLTADLRWIVLSNRKLKKLVKRNSVLKDKYKNQRCFIVLNGPSLKKHDLSKLRNEIVITTNFFYRSDLAELIEPNFVCWQDATFLVNDAFEEIKEEIFTKFSNIKLIINSKGYNPTSHDDRVFYTYNKHLPHQNRIHSNLSGNCSAFSTVAFYAINCAIYMGFKDIYLLGLDFGPGGFQHFANLGVECDNPQKMSQKEEVCAEYWSYSKAHFESFALNSFAKKKGCNVVNLNSDSYIRGFDFGNFNNLF